MKKTPVIKIKRLKKGKKSTLGKLYINDVFFCYTLEDKVRTRGIKIKGETAIPDLTYKGKITFSNRFKRDMLLIYNKPDLSIEDGVVRFTGVRIHGGNTHNNTEGCVLVAHNIAQSPDENHEDYIIYKTAEYDLMKKLKSLGGDFVVIIENCFEDDK